MGAGGEGVEYRVWHIVQRSRQPAICMLLLALPLACPMAGQAAHQFWPCLASDQATPPHLSIDGDCRELAVGVGQRVGGGPAPAHPLVAAAAQVRLACRREAAGGGHGGTTLSSVYWRWDLGWIVGLLSILPCLLATLPAPYKPPKCTTHPPAAVRNIMMSCPLLPCSSTGFTSHVLASCQGAVGNRAAGWAAAA